MFLTLPKDSLDKYSNKIKDKITEKELERFKKNGDLCWNDFKFGNKHLEIVERFLKKRIEFDMKL